MYRNRASRQSGQILVIAILVLGVLLSIGFLFSGIIARNINQTGDALKRTQGGDLADAGIRYAHTQLQSSVLGADWRPGRTAPDFVIATGLSRDPDAYYLRPASNFGLRSDADPVLDKGGPDGLGPFTRINFDKGRALIRITYSPEDFALINSGASTLLQPGRARSFLRIESIGRPGRFDINDPTRNSQEAYKVTNYTNSADFRLQLSQLKSQSTRQSDSKKLVAFASIGLIENSRFITNKFKQTRPAEIGSPSISAAEANSAGLGANYEGQNVFIPTVMGGTVDLGSGIPREGSGSLVSNADVVLHGRITTTLDKETGDVFQIAGSIKPANSQASLTIRQVNGGVVTPVTLAGNFITSTSNQFGTLNGLLRDGFAKDDLNGFTRRVGRKEPPSFLANDPATGLNKYLVMTRDSGPTVNGRNAGRFGYGQGIYVDSRERGNLATESEREAAGASKSLANDWMNPNNTDSVAWKGPFYIPLATYVQLLPDGFTITRDSKSESRFWRRLDGSQTTTSRIRYRLREVTLPTGELQVYSINSIVNPVAINTPDASLSDATFINFGQPFNGVIFSEGDIRIRGIIPTDRQMTVASLGTIYIEGSITKGIVNANGTVINRPSESMLMLMAKDNVAVNTTMFFGPAQGEVTSPKRVDPLPNTPNPIELDLTASRSLDIQSEFLLNPVDDATGRPNTDPTSWTPYATSYQTADGNRYSNAGRSTFPVLMVSHSSDDNGPSFIDLGITPISFADPAPTAKGAFLFNRNGTFNVGAGSLYGGTGNIPIYGLTTPSVNAYPRFETITQTICGPDSIGWAYTSAQRKLFAPVGEDRGNYAVAMQDPSIIGINLTSVASFTSKNYAISRVAVNPHDVRIEAAIFAEDGSFYVIPGPAFNMNPDDTRPVFDADVASLGLVAAQDKRYQEQGTMPGAPFFGEPLNVRVSIIGAVTENMPAPIAQQSEWQRKWGWMPRTLPGTNLLAPLQHVPAGYNIVGAAAPDRVLPNFVITYDSALAQNSADGVNPLRRTPDGQWSLPPMPRLPVSPGLAYFGEEKP